MDRTVYTRRKAANLVQTAVIMAALVGILLLLSWLFAGEVGVVIICIVGLPLLALGGRNVSSLILKMYRATPLLPHNAPALCGLVGELSDRAGVDPPPALYYIPSRALLAFSVGLSPNGAIALSDGMLRLLSWRELVGVVAHEVSHISANDTLVMGVADLASRMGSAISFAGQFLIVINIPVYLLGGHSMPWLPLLLMALVPTAMSLLQLALSRSREYDADLGAVALTGDSEGLASALIKIEDQERRLMRRLLLPGGKIEAPSVLRTHPATTERIRRLLELSGHSGGGKSARSGYSAGGPIIREVEPPGKKPRRRISGLWY